MLTLLLTVDLCWGRSASLDHVTKLLREQLDQATTVNEALSNEVRELRAQRDEFETREADFKREEQVAQSFISNCNSSSSSATNSLTFAIPPHT